MALWLMRGGRDGEYEDRFLADGRIYLTWGDTFGGSDLTSVKTLQELRSLYHDHFPDYSAAKLSNYTGQVWSFLQRMKAGDWVVMPRKNKSSLAVGEILAACVFDAHQTDSDYRHHRSVKWLNPAVPRSVFSLDLLYSIGAIMTICEIGRNNAESRVRAIASSGWKPEAASQIVGPSTAKDDESATEDADASVGAVAAELARTAISKLIYARFKGDRLKRLVKTILEAKGFIVHDPGIGPDGGIDLLAAQGGLGFAEPRLCVQVKCLDGPIERAVLDQLLGTMSKVGATHGLLVSWGGFKTSYDRETANQFFRVRLWTTTILSTNCWRVTTVWTSKSGPTCR